MKTCDHCGEEFTPARYQQAIQRYCSSACKKAADEAARAPAVWRECPGFECENIFKPKRKDSKFCSTACGRKTRDKVRRRVTPVVLDCKECKQEFLPKPNQLYCSTSCQNAVTNRRYRANNLDKVKAAQKRWRAANPDYAKRDQRKRYYQNLEKERERARVYREKRKQRNESS